MKKKLTKNDVLKYIKSNTEQITKTLIINNSNCLYEEKILNIEDFLKWLEDYT